MKRKELTKNKSPIGIYIHIPFCDRVCNYCDFTVFQGAGRKYDEYVNAIRDEIKLRKNKDYIVDTIFIGGGTPSVIDANYIHDILGDIREAFTVLDDIEITIETNPKTLDEKKLKIYEKSGINRISLGIQSFDDEILKYLGRNHNSKEALDTVKLIKNYNFSLNLDFIFGYEKQTLEDIKNDLRMIERINPEHISYYSLIIEEGTKFWVLYKNGKLKQMYDEKERRMYHTIVEFLNKIGIKQYEISNFAKIGKESEHNKKYWKCKEYLSFGVGAHSYLDYERFSNTKNFSKYIRDIAEKKIPVDFSEKLDLKTRKFEYIIMNMRLNKGFSIKEYNLLFGEDFIDKNKKILNKYIDSKIIVIENGYMKFTDKGRDITDTFFIEFI